MHTFAYLYTGYHAKLVSGGSSWLRWHGAWKEGSARLETLAMSASRTAPIKIQSGRQAGQEAWTTSCFGQEAGAQMAATTQLSGEATADGNHAPDPISALGRGGSSSPSNSQHMTGDAFYSGSWLGSSTPTHLTTPLHPQGPMALGILHSTAMIQGLALYSQPRLTPVLQAQAGQSCSLQGQGEGDTGFL